MCFLYFLTSYSLFKQSHIFPYNVLPILSKISKGIYCWSWQIPFNLILLDTFIDFAQLNNIFFWGEKTKLPSLLLSLNLSDYSLSFSASVPCFSLTSLFAHLDTHLNLDSSLLLFLTLNISPHLSFYYHCVSVSSSFHNKNTIDWVALTHLFFSQFCRLDIWNPDVSLVIFW